MWGRKKQSKTRSEELGGGEERDNRNPLLTDVLRSHPSDER
jgi:hypothetical protein